MILKLWSEHVKPEHEDRIPLLCSPIIKDTLLVIGMNPSFNYDAIRQNQKLSKKKVDQLYMWSGPDSQAIQIAKTEEMQGHLEYRRYFGQLTSIFKRLKLGAESIYHLDLFPYRSTNQKKVESLFSSGGKYQAMRQPLLEIAALVINQSSPRIILVANAGASNIFIKELRDVFDLDPKTEVPSTESGYHTVAINGVRVPIFFSGMITGQRALDRYSRERLTYLMKKSLQERG